MLIIMHAKCKLLLTGKSSMFVCIAILVIPQVLRNICNYVYVTGYAKFDHLSANKSLIFLVLALS